MTEIIPFSDPIIELIDHMGTDIDVAYAAWVSSSAGDERTKDVGRWEGLVAALAREHHSSPFEMCEVKFRVETSIMVVREWFRHRTQSYNEQSGRYTKFEPYFYVPGPDRPLINVGTSMKPDMQPADEELHEWFVQQLIEGYEDQFRRYEEALERGISKEMARLHISVGIKTTFYAKANLLNWLKFVSRRTSLPNSTVKGHPQYEIAQLALEVERLLTEKFPVTMRLFNEFGRVAP